MGIFDERALFERGPVVLFCWRAVDGWPVEHVSINVGDVLGYDREAFLSGAVVYSSLVHEDDIARVASEVANGSASGAPAFEHEPYRLRREDGRVIWLYDFTHVIRDETGSVTHFVGYVFDITSRIEGENDRLRLARLVHDSRTDAFARGTPDIFLTVDEAGAIAYASPAAKTVLGYEPTDLVGSPLVRLMPMHLREVHERGFSHYLKTRQRTMPWSGIALRALHADGFEVDVEAAFGEYEAAGKRYITAVLRDVTERKRQTELLLGALELKRAVMDGSPMAIMACKGTGTISLANDRAGVMFETTTTKLAGTRLAVLLGAEAGAALRRLAAETIFTREVRTIELPFYGVEGTKTIRHVVSPLDRDDFVVSSEDVTKVRASEAALAREAARLSSLVSHLGIGVYVEDDEKRVVVVNTTFCKMFGVDDPSSLVGQVWTDVLPIIMRDWKHVDERLTRIEGLRTARVATLRDVVEMTDDRVFERDYLPVTEGSVFHGHLWTFTDVTAGRRAQAKIMALADALERRADHLAAINGELEAFSYSVSHDLRAPLRTIHGFALALSEDYASSIDAQGKSYLERILNGASRMGVLIDDMLELARLGRANVTRRPVDLSEIARSIAEELVTTAPGRTVTWNIEDGIVAEADPTLIRAALGNLLGNAHKYTRKVDHAIVDFFVEASDEGDRVFVVRDNGAGFDMAHAKRLFAAFERLHARSDFEGTGVGLATVKRIVGKHGGRIWAEAAAGSGATFRFTLPREHDVPRG